MTDIRVSKIRVSKIRVTKIRLSEIRVTEIRISSNHCELHVQSYFLVSGVNVSPEREVTHPQKSAHWLAGGQIYL